MNFLQFPDVNRILSLLAHPSAGFGSLLALVRRGLLAVALSLSLPRCGPPAWQGGIHAQLAWSHKGVRVVEVPADSPAQRGDLREDDRLLTVDGKSIRGLPIETVHELLSGRAGSTAIIEVLRGGQELTLQIVREPYDTKGVGL